MIRALHGLVAILGIVLGGGALADPASPVLARVVESGKLRVAMTGDQPPLNARSKSGELIGFEVDLAQLLARSMQVELQIVEKPFSAVLDAVVKGEADLAMSGITITPERNLRVAFVGPYFVSGKSVLTKSQTLAAADEAADIDDPAVRLAALEGSTSEQFVKLVLPKTTLVPVDGYEAGVKKVLDDEVDALVADYPICLLSVLRHPDRGLASLLTPLTIEPVGIALPANDALLVNLVQNYLSALKATGVLEALRATWFEDGSWLAQLP